MDKLEKAKKLILDKLSERPALSYANIEYILENENLVEPDTDVNSVNLPGYPTLLYWYTENRLVIDATLDLIDKNKITQRPVSAFVYAVDGMAPRLPVATKIHHYKKTHWVPTVFDLKT